MEFKVFAKYKSRRAKVGTSIDLKSLGLLFDFLVEPLFLMDDEGRILLANRVFAGMTGLDTLEGRKITEVLHFGDDDLHLILDELKKCNKRRCVVDGVALRGNPAELAVVILGELSDAENLYCGVLRKGTIQEVEEKEGEAPDLFRMLSEHALVGVYLIQDGLFRYVNPTLAAIFGYRREEIIDRLGPLDLTHPEDRELVAENTKKRLEGQADQVRYSFRGLRKDGKVILVEVLGTRVLYKGKPAVLGTLLDITEHRRMFEKIKSSEKRFRMVVENANDLILILDDKGRVLFANRKALEITGYKLSEWKGKPFSSLLLPEELDKARQIFRAVLRGEKIRRETRIFKRDGGILVVSFMAVPLKEGSKVKGAICFGKDLTKESDLEKKLSALYEVITRMPVLKDIDELVEIALDAIVSIIQLENTSVFFVDDKRKELYVKSIRGIHANIRLPLDGKGITVWVANHGKPLIVKDTRKDPRYVEGIKGMLSEIAVPIKIREKVVGVINAESPRPNAFTEDDLKLLEILAAGIGTAMENLQLIQSISLSERRYRLLTQSASDAIIWVDSRGRVKMWNRAAERLFGYAESEVLGKELYELIIPEKDRERFLKAFRRAMFGGRNKPHTSKTMEVIGLRKDGSTIPLEVSVTTVQIEEEREVLAIIRDVSERKEAERKLRESFRKLRKTLDEVVRTVVRIVETRDPYTAGHQMKVAELAAAIAREMGLDKRRVRTIYVAGMLHDIGKIHIPAEILSKPSALTEAEMNIIKTHPVVGYDILKNIDFDGPVAEIVLQHHERLDGSGYPRGLKGDEILLEARILGVADVVEAMASHRPYRPAMGIDKALEEIKKYSGILYDPEVVKACLRVFEKGFTWTEKGGAKAPELVYERI
ncbi:MAG: hypothetical protein DRQ06_02825 [Candidatus Hydrothermota bacterium]|nr:MAG: hypothetical protein DRQ06_02825 [Candidatus Hydrothermae bacterium]